MTIHDAIPIVRPHYSNPSFTVLFHERAYDAAERADAIVCPSEHAKKDLVEVLRVAPEKVHVITEAPAPHFRVLERKGDRDFFLVVGSLELRKNPFVVLNALKRFPRSHSPHVVFVGPKGGIDVIEEARSRGLEGSVSHVGVVSDEELVGLYNEATALIFPSLYEGFGLPIVEAFACGTPVIASSNASIPEVAGDAAVLFDPSDADVLAEAMRNMTGDKREEMKKRGFERLTQFSRARVCDQLSHLYSELDS